MTTELKPGRLYIAKEKKAMMTFDLFKQCELCSWPSLLITRDHPDHLMEVHGIGGDNVLWLSTTTGKGNLDPTELNRLSETMVRHLRMNEGALIMLDGLEYLTSMNEFRRVQSIVDRMYEEAALNKGIFLTTVDPTAFDSKELAFLERNAVCLEEGDVPVIPST